MIKIAIENLILITMFLIIMYILFAVGNGEWDMVKWEESVRQVYAVFGGFGSLMLIVGRWMV